MTITIRMLGLLNSQSEFYRGTSFRIQEVNSPRQVLAASIKRLYVWEQTYPVPSKEAVLTLRSYTDLPALRGVANGLGDRWSNIAKILHESIASLEKAMSTFDKIEHWDNLVLAVSAFGGKIWDAWSNVSTTTQADPVIEISARSEPVADVSRAVVSALAGPTISDLIAAAGISNDTFRRVRKDAGIEVTKKGAKTRPYPANEISRMLAAARVKKRLDADAMSAKWAQYL